MAPDELADLRLTYTAGSLDPTDLAPSPLEQFRRWFDDAAAHPGVDEPNAMVLSTTDPDGGPASRTVLCKGVDGEGFRFYTNLASRKGRQLQVEPRVSLLFAWYPLQRQLVVRGTAEPLPRAETGAYFASRPYGSRIGAWASRQSEPVAGRHELEEREALLRERWPDTGSPTDVPLPEHWGGFLVRPAEVELWQGRPSRLHDRLVFVAVSGSGRLDVVDDWAVERRAP